jgi:23S rRNA (cytosine1962-C5)-methyltransferase
MRYSKNLKEYELLDMANGEKLERWGEYILIRPDPQIVWDKKTNKELWKKADARYIRSSTGGGYWEKLKKMKDSWDISYLDMKFNIKLMGFKHTGLFPEQSVNWDYMIDKISKKRKEEKEVKVLNLFSYTGGASVACLSAGANVCHVDSSQGMTNWAKENVKSSGLENKPIRFLVDDVLKFVKREIRRGNKYDCIIMDPPSYGRGKNGEVWNIEENIYELIELCSEILTVEPLFFIVNTYTGGLSGTIIENSIKIALKDFNITNLSFDEIGLKQKDSDMFLPCGITTICEFQK